MRVCCSHMGSMFGAYYLAGYAVECALKACIARKTRRFDFPDKKAAIESHTHNLVKLVELADLKPHLDATLSADKAFKLNWTAVINWKAEHRYNLDISADEAKGLYGAISAKRSGMMAWIKRHW